VPISKGRRSWWDMKGEEVMMEMVVLAVGGHS